MRETLKYSDILVKMGQIPRWIFILNFEGSLAFLIPSACRYSQNPQLEGVNRDRLLFEGRVRRVSSLQLSQLSPHPSYFSLGNQGGQFDAGTTQGITTGARCEVYWDNNSTIGTPLGALVVSQVASDEDVSFLRSIPNGVLEELRAEACLRFPLP